MAQTDNYGQEIFLEVEEHPTAVSADIHGTVPEWISGDFFRAGPGKYKWGSSSYNHWFEGDAILNRFHISNGGVEFSSKFLRSASYVESQKKNAITISDFATNAPPDPCQNIFQRFMSYFFSPIESRDNCNVNVVKAKERFYATGDITTLWEIDANTLDCRASVDISRRLPGVRSWTSHPHFAQNGDYYNCSASYDNNVYEFVRIPAAGNFNGDALDGIEVVASLPFSHRPSYFHCFGMSERHFLFIEGSLFVTNYFNSERLNKIATHLLNKTHRDLLKFDPRVNSRLHLIERKSGKVIASYEVDPFFSFHQVNFYETEDEVVFDITVYPDDSVIDNLYLSNIKSGKTKDAFPGQLRRYRLPLKGVSVENPLRMHLPRDSMGLDYELIHPNYEMPKINYEHYNGKKYRYTYGVGNSSIRKGLTTLLKIDVDTKQAYEWQEDNCYPSEPVFIPSPDSKGEDDGVVISAVLGLFHKSSFLLILDGETMNEIARAYVPAKLIPLFHTDFFHS
eukprot:gene9144-16807_t